MNAVALPTVRAPSRIRMAMQRAAAKAFPTWVYPGPVTQDGIWTQDSKFLPWCFDLNYWQEGYTGEGSPVTAAVEAAVSAYAQTAAMLPAKVWKTLPNGGRQELPQTPLAKILRQPNSYQTRSDFVLNQVRALLLRGNCYALAETDANDVPIALHPLYPTNAMPYINPESGDVFYSIAPTDMTPADAVKGWPLDMQRMVPARYVWHCKLATTKSPLIGETPLQAAYPSMAAQGSITAQQATFFRNMSRPSGTLNTDMVLNAAQANELRARWAEHSAGIALGGVPVLSSGLKWQALSMSSADAQLIDYYKLSTADIARVLRIPLPLIGEDSQSFGTTEVLMQFWIASGLGFLLDHIENSLGMFFDLSANEYVELDTDALLRSNFKERIEGIVRGVQGGVLTPNEGRAREGLPAVEAGDEPRMQQQVVPLTYWDEKLRQDQEQADAQIAYTEAQTENILNPPSPPPAPAAPTGAPEPEESDEQRAARIGNLRAMVMEGKNRAR